MKWLGLALFLSLLDFSPPLYANDAVDDYEHPEEWRPFYNQCVRRFNNSEVMVQLEHLRSLSDEPNESMDELLNYPKEACSCMARKAHKSFQGENSLNTLEIRLLAFLFRFNTQYPDSGVATRFGYAVLPCVDAGF